LQINFLKFEKYFFSNPPVIISSPSEDHTYSAGNGTKHETANGGDNQSNGTSSDAAYESSEER
jgi:hypothetical protein